MREAKWSGRGHLCTLTMSCLSLEHPSGSILLCQARMHHGGAKAPPECSFPETFFSSYLTLFMWSINLKVHVHLSAWKPGPRHEVSIIGGTVGMAFLKCLTFPWLLHVPVTGCHLSHSVKKQEPFSLPWLSACVVQDWKPLELDKSEIPKLKICPFYLGMWLST